MGTCHKYGDQYGFATCYADEIIVYKWDNDNTCGDSTRTGPTQTLEITNGGCERWGEYYVRCFYDGVDNPTF